MAHDMGEEDTLVSIILTTIPLRMGYDNDTLVNALQCCPSKFRSSHPSLLYFSEDRLYLFSLYILVIVFFLL